MYKIIAFNFTKPKEKYQKYILLNIYTTKVEYIYMLNMYTTKVEHSFGRW